MKTMQSLRRFSTKGKSGVGGAISYRGRKRFYKDVDVSGNPSDGYKVLLDGRTLKTPHRNELIVPTKALGEGVAYEWDRQVKHIEPSSMPLMTVTCSAIDITNENREIIVEELLRYLSTDTVLFPSHPLEAEQSMLDLQARLWNPLTSWMERTYGPVSICNDLRIDPHPQETVEAVESKLKSLDHWHLTALESLALACKSIIIPLALHARAIDVKHAVEASRVEEEHQIQQWGLVEGAQDVDRCHVGAQVAAASVFLRTLPN